ncbi:PP2C family protein-serine/threonine phosphatase [Actinomadura decatromicini]|uniref:Serine/threonine protein phosphatase n=1 Tax=Actinomadura decatromicini TaxID=2604572 RepID=A0A5D3FNQ4_9ACTN|nr:protein phosphatase 2C domain-containing protein [Actinomadura decatromicini]TYK50427.1 serine/threonine protein phosphatase [Actinomadura decatromicini]
MDADQHTHAGPCHGCGQPVRRGERFCEQCGRPAPPSPNGQARPGAPRTARPATTLTDGPTRTRAEHPAPTAPAPPWSNAPHPAPTAPATRPGAADTRADLPVIAECADCGGGVIGADGYCEQCGLRRPSSAREGRGHFEIDLGFLAAAVSDRGLRRRRNEDAVALAALPAGACGVVCDGVATAPGSDEASRRAADAAAAVLSGRVAVGVDARDATRAAAERAAEVVTGLAPSQNPDEAPACTFVSAVVDRAGVTVGWVGDSRAYWLAPGGSSLLTRDDSWAARMVDSGELSEAAAWADRRAHVLTAWLGADAGAVEARVAAFRPAVPGLVMLCSDGLWNHLPEPSALAAVAFAGGADGPAGAARRLLRAALDAGGHDNVTVAVIPYPTSREPGR